MKQVVRFGVLLLLAAAVGCGSHAKTVVKGKVTVGGKGPLTGGAIQFVLASDAAIKGGGMIKPDGSYEVLDAPIGECKVVIDNKHLAPPARSTMPGPAMTSGPPKDLAKKMGEAPTKGEVPPAGDPNPGSSPGAPKYVKIDAAFADPEKTPLKSTVTSGLATPSDFDVK